MARLKEDILCNFISIKFKMKNKKGNQWEKSECLLWAG